MPRRLCATDLSIQGGQLVALVGPNGGGKTSLLRALAGVEDASGEVRIDGERVAGLGEARRRTLLAFLPASRELGWPIAARDVIVLGLATRDEARIDALIDLFELGALADRPINRLSTGERTRVLLARAMAAGPKLLLLDEPFANLEPYWVLRLGTILRDLANDGIVVLVALHDLGQLERFDRALLIAERAVQMDKTPASLVASERFEHFLRISAAPGGWRIRPADRRSSR
ncbi:MAG: ATP-binding cassette domain-containing protein [Pseudomonadota bacterium]|nr:ATP-binding cassette domain-containing protein [Pseudomonadota bacterium]